MKDPSEEDWDRLRRYGSWIRELRFSELHPDQERISWCSRELTIGKTVFTQLSLTFPTGLVCSGLQKLKWLSSHDWLPSLRHFLSPTLAEIKIFTTPPDGPLQTPLPSIPVLPGSYLRSLHLTFHPTNDEAFGNSASVTILQCGAFLEGLQTSAQLSEAAVSHLVGLRHLRTLRIGSDPPAGPLLPSSDVFPSLKILILDGAVGHKWLPFLGAAQGNCSTDGDSRTTEVGMRGSLTNLYCLGGTPVDPAFISSLCIFRKLTHVFVDGSCTKGGGCTFLLTDGDLTKLANALPDIKSLRLGSPCSANRCRTTALSLLALSTHCLKLETLEVHFDTTKIARVLDRLFKEPQYERMRSLQRCPLQYLAVADTPISTDDVNTVAIHLSGIFHGLQGFHCRNREWIEVSRQVQLLSDPGSQTLADARTVSMILRQLLLYPPQWSADS